jgi:hypothetical protein
MTTLQTVLLAGGLAATFLICVLIVIIAGQVHRLVQAAETGVELLEREDERQRRLMQFLRERNYNPQ